LLTASKISKKSYRALQWLMPALVLIQLLIESQSLIDMPAPAPYTRPCKPNAKQWIDYAS